MVVEGVPSLYKVVSRGKIARWKGYEKAVGSIQHCLRRKKYLGTELGKKLLAIAKNEKRI